MARRDGTGPRGMGPMTGRGLGPCGAGKFHSGRGMGLGYGRGYGRGRGICGFYNSFPIDEETERAFLEEERSILETRLRNVEKRLGSIEEEDE